MLLIIKRLWQVNWAEQWQYRANLLMYQLFWLVSPVVYLAVWVTIATNQGSVSGQTSCPGGAEPWCDDRTRRPCSRWAAPQISVVYTIEARWILRQPQ